MSKVRAPWESAVVRCALVGAGLLVLSSACAPNPTATRLEITTIETVCAGVEPPEGPACSTAPVGRSVEVHAGDDVVAAGTTDSSGVLVVRVPPGELVVSVPDAEPFLQCDAPSVTALAGRTTPVTQSCTVALPSPPGH